MTTSVFQTSLLGSLGGAALGTLMFVLSIFLILLILVQRGKGGGLTGALGGPGGQSAFGSKAGDTFTLITAVSAIVWGLVCAIAMYTLGVPPLNADDAEFGFDDAPALTAPGDQTPAAGLSGLSDALAAPAGDSLSPAAGDSLSPAAGDDPAEPSVTPVEADPSAAPAETPSLELTPAETTPAETTPE